jgi:hypothetical protein
MVRIFDSMKNERKSIILDSAERFIGEHTE